MAKELPFNRKETSFKDPKHSDDTTSSIAAAYKNIAEAMGLESNDYVLTDRIYLHLRSLEGEINSNTVDIRREMLKVYTLSELLAIAQRSSKEQWTARPAYYLALLMEIEVKRRSAARADAPPVTEGEGPATLTLHKE